MNAPPPVDPRDTEHGIADLQAVSDSMRKDPERWELSYRDHTATALHRRAIAPQNGHNELGWEKD